MFYLNSVSDDTDKWWMSSHHKTYIHRLYNMHDEEAMHTNARVLKVQAYHLDTMSGNSPPQEADITCFSQKRYPHVEVTKPTRK